MTFSKGGEKKMGSKAQFKSGRSTITGRVGIQPQLNNYIISSAKPPNTLIRTGHGPVRRSGGRILIAYQLFI